MTLLQKKLHGPSRETDVYDTLVAVHRELCDASVLDHSELKSELCVVMPYAPHERYFAEAPAGPWNLSQIINQRINQRLVNKYPVSKLHNGSPQRLNSGKDVEVNWLEKTAIKALTR